MSRHLPFHRVPLLGFLPNPSFDLHTRFSNEPYHHPPPNAFALSGRDLSLAEDALSSGSDPAFLQTPGNQPNLPEFDVHQFFNDPFPELDTLRPGLDFSAPTSFVDPWRSATPPAQMNCPFKLIGRNQISFSPKSSMSLSASTRAELDHLPICVTPSSLNAASLIETATPIQPKLLFHSSEDLSKLTPRPPTPQTPTKPRAKKSPSKQKAKSSFSKNKEKKPSVPKPGRGYSKGKKSALEKETLKILSSSALVSDLPTSSTHSTRPTSFPNDITVDPTLSSFPLQIPFQGYTPQSQILSPRFVSPSFPSDIPGLGHLSFNETSYQNQCSGSHNTSLASSDPNDIRTRVGHSMFSHDCIVNAPIPASNPLSSGLADNNYFVFPSQAFLDTSPIPPWGPSNHLNVNASNRTALYPNILNHPVPTKDDFFNKSNQDPVVMMSQTRSDPEDYKTTQNTFESIDLTGHHASMSSLSVPSTFNLPSTRPLDLGSATHSIPPLSSGLQGSSSHTIPPFPTRPTPGAVWPSSPSHKNYSKPGATNPLKTRLNTGRSGRQSKPSTTLPSTPIQRGPPASVFVNFTPKDSKKLLSGVAPSGSSKRKASSQQALVTPSKRRVITT